jgi:hypothetical protein
MRFKVLFYVLISVAGCRKKGCHIAVHGIGLDSISRYPAGIPHGDMVYCGEGKVEFHLNIAFYIFVTKY